MIPLLRTTLGLKGHRPDLGNLDGHDLVHIFGALNLVTGQWTTRLIEKLKTPTKPKKSPSGQRCLQEGFARHVRDIARAYPAAHYPRVLLVIDNAPWHQGALIIKALKEFPHLELYRLPSYSPQLQVIERF
jgi:DDE superfamily endonuclease